MFERSSILKKFNLKNPQFQEQLRAFMQGRYGADQLSVALFGLGIVLFVLFLPFHFFLVKWLPLIPIILCYYRIFSRQIYKRQQENFKFIRFYTPLVKEYRILQKRFKERKTYRYFKCPSCKQTLRVPRGKGKISITCPKCKNVFHNRT